MSWAAFGVTEEHQQRDGSQSHERELFGLRTGAGRLSSRPEDGERPWTARVFPRPHQQALSTASLHLHLHLLLRDGRTRSAYAGVRYEEEGRARGGSSWRREREGVEIEREGFEVCSCRQEIGLGGEKKQEKECMEMFSRSKMKGYEAEYRSDRRARSSLLFAYCI